MMPPDAMASDDPTAHHDAPAPAGGRLLLLGPPCWQGPAGERPFLPERRYQLLAWLAQHADWVGRERLAALLWPEHDSEAARRNLRKVLFRIREVPDLPPIEERGVALRWPVATDLAEFERAAAAGDHARAAALWRGDPWQGLDTGAPGPLTDWLAFERGRLRGLWRQAVLALAGAADPAPAAAWARRLLAADALDEEALRLLLRALAATGPQGEARQAYQRFAEALAEAVGLEPTLETRALLDAPAAAPTPLAPPQPFPVRVDRFIGRRAELHELAGLLAQPGCRWVTLVGPGGIGKTRLLLQALPELAARHADGAVFAAFDDLGDDGQVGARLADALGLKLSARSPALVQVGRALAGQRRLLALDNVEHLPRGMQAIAQVLQDCPDVCVLATSRTRLPVPGEWVLPLQGLPWPGSDDADRAEDFDAVRLFRERARQHGPGLDRPGELATIARICEAVEGLPLALELAAVWTRQFSVAEIADELARGASEMLAGPGPAEIDAAPRQRSMAASFEHSWQLLVPAEREALARLALLRGGFTRDAARQLGAAALALLAALQDKSLVRRDDGAVERYSLHPMVQQFAAARLEAVPVWREAAAGALTDHFLRRLARMPGAQRTAERTAFCRALAPDLENIVAAWLGAAAAARADLLVPAITPLRLLHVVLARWDELVPLLERARAALATEPRALAELDVSLSAIDYYGGRYAASLEAGRRALRALARGGDRALVRNALDFVGQSGFALGRFAEARAFFERGLALAQADGDALAMSNCHSNLGTLAIQFGQWDDACERNAQALALRRSVGSETALVLNNLGLSQVGAGRLEAAIRTLHEGLTVSEAESNPAARAFLNVSLAQALWRTKDVEQAHRQCEDADRLLRRGLAPTLRSELDLLRARVASAQQRHADARALVREVARDALARAQRPLQAATAVVWGECLAAQGQAKAARALLDAASRHAELEQDERNTALAALARLGGAAPPAAAPAQVVATQLQALVDAD
ncbi:MAG: tetratricopeptide repeat protein [Piscinibacter sp.]|nr:tetratricopeptide repeat protein [Piscinibacter sp.]